MTVYYGVNKTKTRAVPAQLIPEGDFNGRVRSAYDTYALSAALSAADTIELFDLPPKARVVGYWISWDASLDASGGTLDLGWKANASDAADPDGFADGLDVTSAGQYSQPDGTSDKMAGLGKKFAGDDPTTVQITVATEWDQTSGNIYVCMFFVID